MWGDRCLEKKTSCGATGQQVAGSEHTGWWLSAVRNTRLPVDEESWSDVFLSLSVSSSLYFSLSPFFVSSVCLIDSFVGLPKEVQKDSLVDRGYAPQPQAGDKLSSQTRQQVSIKSILAEREGDIAKGIYTARPPPVAMYTAFVFVSRRLARRGGGASGSYSTALCCCCYSINSCFPRFLFFCFCFCFVCFPPLPRNAF